MSKRKTKYHLSIEELESIISKITDSFTTSTPLHKSSKQAKLFLRLLPKDLPLPRRCYALNDDIHLEWSKMIRNRYLFLTLKFLGKTIRYSHWFKFHGFTGEIDFDYEINDSPVIIDKRLLKWIAKFKCT